MLYFFVFFLLLKITKAFPWFLFLFYFTGSNLHPKQGFGFLNLFYSDNADLILSCLIHLLNKSVDEPFPKNLSIQFDNASNNKCNEAFALFAYLVLEGVFYNVSLKRKMFLSNTFKYWLCDVNSIYLTALINLVSTWSL